MIRRRIGRPGLIGTMARTAVIAGTATAVSGGIQRSQQANAQAAAERKLAEEFQAAEQVAAAHVPLAPPAASPGNDMLAQLAQLGQMNQAGLIDDTEFAAAKAKLLGI